MSANRHRSIIKESFAIQLYGISGELGVQLRSPLLNQPRRHLFPRNEVRNALNLGGGALSGLLKDVQRDETRGECGDVRLTQCGRCNL